MATGFLDGLYQVMHTHIATLESMFGERDKRFVIGNIKEAPADNNKPHTDYPHRFHTNGGCVVDICISIRPYKNLWHDQAAWQVAHECVHLLDPTKKGDSNYLEEGLATWYQDEPRFHDAAVQEYIKRNRPHPPNYAKAQALVRKNLHQLLPTVKAIRESGIRICDIKSDTLGRYLPAAVRTDVEQLCERFPSKFDPCPFPSAN